MSSSRRYFLGASAGLITGAASAQSPIATHSQTGKAVYMIVHSRRPEDYEMPLDGFTQSVTPTELFYVRSHHYTPTVDLERYQLKVGGEVNTPLAINLRDLKRMPKVELMGVMECAGNGRALYSPRMPGLQWTYGGVGSARWAGVRLADVLKRAGLKATAKNILFDGADVPVGAMPKFQRTIPIKKAMDPDTMLAYDMNGAALTPAHGFPLRVVVPGWGGDAWVKWVTGITVLDKEFDGFFMKTGYRHPGKGVTPGSTVDPALMKPVEGIRVKSVIASPQENNVMGQGTTVIRGAAWSGETPLAKVEVSVDGGKLWQLARLTSSNGVWGMQTWDFNWNATPGTHRISCRATDASGYTQPMEQEWNPSGYMWNVVHTVRVEVLPMQSAAYKNSCLGCHGEELIRGQKLTRAQWEKEVEKMTRWGAQVLPEHRTPLLDYLSTRYKP